MEIDCSKCCTHGTSQKAKSCEQRLVIKMEIPVVHRISDLFIDMAITTLPVVQMQQNVSAISRLRHQPHQGKK
jgi:hypothetical protein